MNRFQLIVRPRLNLVDITTAMIWFGAAVKADDGTGHHRVVVKNTVVAHLEIVAPAKRLAASWEQRPSSVQLDPSPCESFFGHASEPKPVSLGVSRPVSNSRS